jgi:RNA polymerase sigma-70 factor, ECF subfamily
MERPEDETDPMDHPESVWLAEYRAGRVEALGQLAEHYRRPLFSFILRMTEGHADAEEIFQEVWLRAIRNLDSYKDKSFLSWLFRIAHNLVIDRVRRARPMVDLDAGREEGEGSALETQFAGRGLSPAKVTEGRDMGRRIAEAIARLPAEQREVFLLRTEGDVPFKEIAGIQGISINTALARMQYALGKLRNDLKADYAAVAGGDT